MRKSLSVLLSLFSFLSCSKDLCTFTDPGVPFEPYESLAALERRSALTGRTFNPNLALEELSRPETEERVPFTLNYNWYGSPVVKAKGGDDGKDLFLVVDTGLSYSYIYKSGIEKVFGTEGNFFDVNGTYQWYRENHIDNKKRLKNLSRAKVIKLIRKDLKNGNINTWRDIGGIRFKYYASDEVEINGQRLDGVLGADFLMKHKNVVFDFKENYMYFDQSQIDGTVLEMKKNNCNNFYVYFSYKGKQELGIVDTGNYTFCPRNGIGDGSPEHDINDKSFGIHGKRKVKQISPAVWTFDDIEIGGIKYDNVKAQYSFTTDSGFNYGAQYHAYCLNNLGNEFFFDHIIQYDFENMKFIIK